MATTTASHPHRPTRHGWTVLRATGSGDRVAGEVPPLERELQALLRDHTVASRAVLAAEDRPTYAADAAASAAGADTAHAEPTAADTAQRSPDTDAPLGLPVLAEVPRLGSALRALTDSDRRAVDAVLELAELRQTDEVASVTGVSLEHWLGIAARQTKMDRRLLLRLCGHLQRFPALREAAGQGRLSFAQLRRVSLELRRAPEGIDTDLDRWLAAALAGLDGSADPDVLVGQVAQAIIELAPVVAADAEQQAGRSRSLTLMPRLDGSGGKAYIDEDAIGFALLDAATAPRPGQLDGTASLDRIRADNLQQWLTHTCDPDDGDAAGGDAADGAGASGTDATLAGEVTSTWQRLPPVKLLARISFESLLDRSQTPAELLTRLVGGRLRLTAATARELIGARGAELRAIIVDEFGGVVGVGRQTRIPPGWLRDATLALHDTCTGPLCDLPARDAQLDHAAPWWPTGPHDPYGTTGTDNIGPLCAGPNRTKEQAGWKVTQTTNGQRTWHHPHTGLRVTTVPATWRPPGYTPPKRAPDRHDPPGDPPGTSGGPPSGADPPGDPPGDPRDVDLDDDGQPWPF